MSWFPGGTKLLISGPGGTGTTGIWTLATIGGEIRKLQDNVGQAVVSPDGSSIVFERQERLWRMGPNGENLERIGQTQRGEQFAGHAGYSNCWGLSWSPNGRWLTYIRKLGETDPLVLEARLPGDGSTAIILRDPDLRSYSWLSPTKIVLNRWESPDQPFTNLWLIDVDLKKMKAVGKPRRLTNWAGFALEDMSASGDGKRLSVTRRTDQSDVFIADLAGHNDNLSSLRRVSLEDRIEWPGSWRGDSKALFFQSDRTGNMNIFEQPMDSTSPNPVVMDQNDNRAPALSPDKESVIYFAWPRHIAQVNKAKLMRKPLAAASSELILEAKGLPGSAQTSYRVVMPTMTGQPVFRCPSQVGAPCVLSEAGSHEVEFYSFAPVPAAAKSALFRIAVDNPNALAWDLSPDGSEVGYAVYDWRSASIHIRELRTNAVRDIPLKGMTELSTISWSADGKSFFVTTFSITGSSLFHVTLDGKYRVLYKGAKEVEGPKPSPDGRHLAFGDVRSASNVWLVEGFPK